MLIVSQDRKTLWSDQFLVNIQLETEDEYQEEERIANQDGDFSVYVNYYPSKGVLRANYIVGDTMSGITLFEGSKVSAEKVLNNLIESLAKKEAVFEIPAVSTDLEPTTELRYIKDKQQKKYIQVKKWAKYEKEHPLTNLRKQIVKVYSV